MLAEHHVSLDFGYERTTENYCIYLLWYLQKNGHLKSTDIINISNGKHLLNRLQKSHG